MFWLKFAEGIKLKMRKPSLIWSPNATISRRWLKFKVNPFSSSRKKLIKSKSSPKSLWLIAMKEFKMNKIFKNKFSKLWKTEKTSKIKSPNMTQWSLNNWKKKEKNFKNFTTAHFEWRKSLFMISQKKIIAKRISIFRHITNYLNLWILKMTTMSMIRSIENW